MDSNQGGPSTSDRQRETAAEIARKKVLAAYSSTVDSIKNLPPSAKDILIKRHQDSAESPVIYEQPTYDEPSTNWSNPTVSSSTSTYDPSSYAQPVYSSPSYDQSNYSQPNCSESSYNYSNSPAASTPTESSNPSALKDVPVDQAAVNAEWQKYHSAWQDYYKNYYSEYYAKAAQTYLATEKMKTERLANGSAERSHRFRRLIPLCVLLLIILGGLFLQYNRLIFAPIMAYISPDTGDVATSIEAVDPSITQAVSPEPRLLIPKLNIDVPVAFSIPTTDVMSAMNHGVAQFSIPGANALPGQIGNLVISGHSAGDIYSSNPYKFIFSGLERLSVGDLIYVNYNSTRYTYQMTGSSVVEPTDVSALIYPTDKPVLTLITCTPLGTSRYRLLISAEQISPSYDTNNLAPTDPETPDQSTDNSMPANEPSFFENLWQGIFGS